MRGAVFRRSYDGSRDEMQGTEGRMIECNLMHFPRPLSLIPLSYA
jgi:hypothetical protein